MSDVRCRVMAAPSRPEFAEPNSEKSGVRYESSVVSYQLSKRGTAMYERPATPEPHLELQSNSQGAPQAFPTSDIWLP